MRLAIHLDREPGKELTRNDALTRHRGDRHASHANTGRSDLQQHRQRQHDRIQARPGFVSGSALSVHGYFGVQLPNGTTSYTRDGSFRTSATGQIVSTEGYAVQPSITIAPTVTSVTVNQAGEVIATGADGKQTTVGRLHLFMFQNEAGLDPQGGNNFLETDASGSPIQGLPTDPGFGTVRQGYLESSNVNVVQEITSLIQAQRAYELNSKVIDAADQMMQTTTQQH
jgi:flagellar basal-body rod protein FlgG